MKYFIAYHYAKGQGKGFGRAEVEMEKKIKTMKAIEEIESELKFKMNFDKVIVINWQKF